MFLLTWLIDSGANDWKIFYRFAVCGALDKRCVVW